MPDNISVEESPSQTSEKEDNEKQNSKRSNSYRCKEGKNVGVFFVLVVILITILVLYKAVLEKQAGKFLKCFIFLSYKNSSSIIQ